MAIVTLVVLAVLGFAVAWAWQPMLLALLQTVAVSRVSADRSRDLEDGLHVGLCGAGSPMPDERRLGACTVVIAGSSILVFDAGNGAARNLSRMGIPVGRVEAVFLTHFHSDHIDGLGELLMQRWVSGGHARPLAVHGPLGVEQVVAGFTQAYSHDRRHRADHHGEKLVSSAGFGALAHAFEPDAADQVTVLRQGDWVVEAFSVDHAPVKPAVGYRVSYKGRQVVISGDTVRSDAVRAAAQGVDLLVHDAMAPQLVKLIEQAAQRAGRPLLQQLMADIADYHATPQDAAHTAHEAGVRYLLLTHIAPPLPALPGVEALFLGDASRVYGGPIRIGRDGDLISLPAGSNAIRHWRLF
jgi:ribonuclease Z